MKSFHDIFSAEGCNEVVRNVLIEAYEGVIQYPPYGNRQDTELLAALRTVIHYFSTEEEYIFFLNKWEEVDQEEYFESSDADAQALASAGWGTDEDYNYYGEYD
jgi:hypothetical protein